MGDRISYREGQGQGTENGDGGGAYLCPDPHWAARICVHSLVALSLSLSLSLSHTHTHTHTERHTHTNTHTRTLQRMLSVARPTLGPPSFASSRGKSSPGESRSSCVYTRITLYYIILYYIASPASPAAVGSRAPARGPAENTIASSYFMLFSAWYRFILYYFISSRAQIRALWAV
jgi:hypothetical protein